MQALKPVRKIVYAKVHGSSKGCLTSEKNTIFPTLRSLLEAFFSKMIKANKKNFIFWQRNCTMNVPSVFISVENICLKHLHQGYYEKLHPGIFL